MTNVVLNKICENVEALGRNIVIIVISGCLTAFTELFKFFLSLLLVFSIGYAIFLIDNNNKENGENISNLNDTFESEQPKEDDTLNVLDMAVIEEITFHMSEESDMSIINKDALQTSGILKIDENKRQSLKDFTSNQIEQNVSQPAEISSLSQLNQNSSQLNQDSILSEIDEHLNQPKIVPNSLKE